jgi:hypothetical protein
VTKSILASLVGRPFEQFNIVNERDPQNCIILLGSSANDNWATRTVLLVIIVLLIAETLSNVFVCMVHRIFALGVNSQTGRK